MVSSHVDMYLTAIVVDKGRRTCDFAPFAEPSDSLHRGIEKAWIETANALSGRLHDRARDDDVDLALRVCRGGQGVPMEAQSIALPATAERYLIRAACGRAGSPHGVDASVESLTDVRHQHTFDFVEVANWPNCVTTRGKGPVP
jgi:hypothetical protein